MFDIRLHKDQPIGQTIGHALTTNHESLVSLTYVFVNLDAFDLVGNLEVGESKTHICSIGGLEHAPPH